jgi:energy-coupling factor transporter ATP-binding protein EcfA2
MTPETSQSMDVTLENVRCFCSEQTVPLRPLTLVVGENSSGKSTLLSVISAVSEASFPSPRPGLDEPPFDLSTYNSIATYKGGRWRAEYFCMGVSYVWRRTDYKAHATYREVDGQPRLSQFTITRGEAELRARLEGRTLSAQILHHGDVVIEVSPTLEAEVELSSQIVYSAVLGAVLPLRDPDKLRRVMPLLQEFELTPRSHREQPPGPASALAPIRSKPLRTYDQTSDEFTPEGGHIPLTLARIWQREEESEHRDALHDAVVQFGSESGLLSDITVRTLGRNPTDPFQLMVDVGGPPRNLADVGYGVSQALPLVVQSVLASQNQRVLVQQPEVHLHPRAQAALGTFFTRLVSSQQKAFVIETHSEYLIDRIRFDVAHRKIERDDVLVLFLERDGVETTVWQLSIDDEGNVVGAPPSYRRFLLEEEVRLVGRSSR